MRILNKYLLKEVFSSSMAVFGVLMIILSSNTMLRLIEEASIGNFPTYLLVPVILIKVTQYSIHIIPISLFFGIIISLGKFYNSNEMAVISSSGQSPLDIVKILSNIIIPASLIVALFSLYITPSVTEYRYKLEHRLNNEERIEEITPGRFISSQSGKATFFIEDIVDNKLNNIFFSTDRKTMASVENSETASYYFNKDNQKFIMLKEGVISEITSANGVETRITKYKEHGLQLRKDIPAHVNSIPAGKSTIDLFFSNETADHAELQSRLLLPIASLILGLIAIPLSYSSPKKGRYSKIFLGAVVYFIYFITMSVAKKIYLLSYIPGFFGLWWIHVLVMSMLIYIYHADSHKIPGRG